MNAADQLSELTTTLTEIKAGFAQVKDLPATVKTLQDENADLKDQLTELRRGRSSYPPPVPQPRGSMSAVITEKSPDISFAALDSHKVGGIVRLPREIDEQSIVQMGHFLARYGAIEFARAEDDWGFLADGNLGFEGTKGIVQIARDNNRTITLAAGKTKPSDATLDDFRNLRTK